MVKHSSALRTAKLPLSHASTGSYPSSYPSWTPQNATHFAIRETRARRRTRGTKHAHAKPEAEQHPCQYLHASRSCGCEQKVGRGNFAALKSRPERQFRG